MENPKIRFKGYTKDWEQRKLGDMGSTFTGLSGKTKEDFGHGDAQFITYMNVFSNPVANLEMTEAVEIDAKQNRVKKGDVFFTTSSETPEEVGMSCVMPENKDNIYLNSFCFGYRPTEKFDLDYLAYVLRADSFRKEMKFLAQGISRYNISKNKVMEVSIPIPNLEEQTMVGRYFSTLDHLITLHQRKCEQTKKLKKYMLQKMFPQNGAKVPEIRFDGFTYDWEQRKLSDVLDIVTKRNGEKYGKEEVLSVSDEYGCINQIKFQGRSFAGEDISNYKIVDTGDIIYTRSPLKSKPYGIIKVVGDEIGIVSPLYIVNKVKEGNNSQFIYRVFDSPEKTNKYLSPLVRKGAKNTMNISNDEWLSGKIDVAPSYEEQYQIGLYFDHLDNLITLHQRQCDELKKMKKYMLQNMFI